MAKCKWTFFCCSLYSLISCNLLCTIPVKHIAHLSFLLRSYSVIFNPSPFTTHALLSDLFLWGASPLLQWIYTSNTHCCRGIAIVTLHWCVSLRRFWRLVLKRNSRQKATNALFRIEYESNLRVKAKLRQKRQDLRFTVVSVLGILILNRKARGMTR